MSLGRFEAKWPTNTMRAIRRSGRKKRKKIALIDEFLESEDGFFMALTKAINTCECAAEIIKSKINLKKRESNEKAPNSHQTER